MNGRLILIVSLFFSVSAFTADAQFVYWTEFGNTPLVVRGPKDFAESSNLESLGYLDGVDNPVGLALDPDNEKIYWGTLGVLGSPVQIMRGNQDMTGTPEVVFDESDGLLGVRRLALDTDAGKVYWADWAEHSNTAIMCGNMDGSGVPETLFNSTSDGLGAVVDVELDIADGKIYWTESITHRVCRGNIDGTGEIEVLYNIPSILWGMNGLALDPLNGHVYWAGSNSIYRGDMDGTSAALELLDESDGVIEPVGLDLDTEMGFIYFTEGLQNGVSSSDVRVRRTRMDASTTIETLLEISFEEGVERFYYDIVVDDNISIRDALTFFSELDANGDGYLELIESRLKENDFISADTETGDLGLSISELIVASGFTTHDSTTVWVDFDYFGTSDGSESKPFDSLKVALNMVKIDGSGVIKFESGNSVEIVTIGDGVFTAGLRLEAPNGLVTIGLSIP